MKRSIAMAALALLLGAGCQGSERESSKQAAREIEHRAQRTMERAPAQDTSATQEALATKESELASGGAVATAVEDETCECPTPSAAPRRPRAHRAAAYPMTAAPMPAAAATPASAPAACPPPEPVVCPAETQVCPGPTYVTVPVPVTREHYVAPSATRYDAARPHTTTRANETRIDSLTQSQRANDPNLQGNAPTIP